MASPVVGELAVVLATAVTEDTAEATLPTMDAASVEDLAATDAVASQAVDSAAGLAAASVEDTKAADHVEEQDVQLVVMDLVPPSAGAV